MNRADALSALISAASAWAENAEELAPRRITAGDTDAALHALAADDTADLETLRQVRDVWAAIDLLDGDEELADERPAPLPRPVPFGQQPALAAICWKHEATPDGVGRVGPVWFRDTLGGMVRSPRWFECPRAQELAEHMGVEFIET